MPVIDPRAGAGLRPYRAAFKANYITAAGSLCTSAGLSLAMREVACGTPRTARAGCGRAHKGVLQHLGQSAHGDEAHLLLDLGVHLVQVAGVVPGDEHRRDALTEGRHTLFLQTADGQHVAVQRDLSGHGQVVVDRDTGQRPKSAPSSV